MGENTQEKSLIEKTEKGLWSKIKNFFKRIFKKKDKNVINENVAQENNDVKENNEFKESIKMTEDEETRLLDLQRRYRRGEIAENDLTEEQIEALSNLYDKQIEELKRTIAEREKKIAEYKKRKMEKKNA